MILAIWSHGGKIAKKTPLLLWTPIECAYQNTQTQLIIIIIQRKFTILDVSHKTRNPISIFQAFAIIG